MKRTAIKLIILLIIVTGCRAKRPSPDIEFVAGEIETAEEKTDYSRPETWILGYFPRERMLLPPHEGWFQKGYDDYTFNADIVNKLTEIPKDDISIKIVMGTWCPDSRREVPRFLRLTDIWKFPAENIIFIGVDDVKVSPVGEYDNLNIQRVPTFIFYKNNIEAGRIIENPETSLEQDIINILSGE